MDWTLVAQVGGFLISAGAILYALGRVNGALTEKMDLHAVNMNDRMDRTDITLSGLRSAIQDTREDVAKIKGKIGMNGH